MIDLSVEHCSTTNLLFFIGGFMKQKEYIPYSGLTKREKYLVDNPSENKNLGYGGYHKWYTKSGWKNFGDMRLAVRVRGWFWRDKPYQPRKK